MSHRPRVASGQVWKERDARFDRYVLVTALEGDRARIQVCTAAGESRSERTTLARLDRFGHEYDLTRDA